MSALEHDDELDADDEPLLRRRTGKLVQLRRRTSAPRAVTTSIRRMSKSELARGRAMYPHEEHWRPKTRGECVSMERPCPFVSCRHHLALDVHPVRGSIKNNFPEGELEDRAESCSLDVADRGGETLETVAEFTNITRERVRQVEQEALAKLLAACPELRETLKALSEQRTQREQRIDLQSGDGDE